jgi:hypothetical protein
MVPVGQDRQASHFHFQRGPEEDLERLLHIAERGICTCQVEISCICTVQSFGCVLIAVICILSPRSGEIGLDRRIGAPQSRKLFRSRDE